MKNSLFYTLGILFIFFTWVFSYLVIGNGIIPSPFLVFKSIINNWSLHFKNIANTGLISMLGILTSLLFSILVVYGIALSTVFKKITTPILLLVKVIPAVAIAPLVITIAGTDLISKIIITSLICFFPQVISGIDAFKKVPLATLELSYVYASNSRNTFANIQIGYVIQGFLSGFKTTSALGVVGAIVSEYIIGGNNFGIGSFIIANIYSSTTINIYSGTVLSGILGIIFFGAATLITNYFDKKLRINYSS